MPSGVTTIPPNPNGPTTARSANATVVANETSLVTPGGAIVMSLPALPPIGTVNTFVNLSLSQQFNVTPAGIGTITHYNTTAMTTLVVAGGVSVVLVHKGGNVWVVLSGGYPPGTQLAVIRHNPSPGTTYTVAATTITTLDATNLAISFIAPPSGQIVIEVTMYVQLTTSSVATGNLWFAFINAAGGAIVGEANRVAQVTFSGQVVLQEVTALWVIDTVTAGAALTLNLGAGRTTGATIAGAVFAGRANSLTVATDDATLGAAVIRVSSGF